VELGGADLPSDLLQPVADDIGSPLVVSEESLQAESLKTVRKPQMVPPANVFLVCVCWPRIVRRADNDLLDVDEARVLEQLTCIVLICD